MGSVDRGATSAGKSKGEPSARAVAVEPIPLILPDLPPLDQIGPDLERMLKSGRVTNFGEQVREFEAEAARYLGVRTATVSSGTMGMLFSLQALGVRPNDFVAIPSFTFTATAQAVLYAGAHPVFVDIDEDLTMSSEDLGRVLAGSDGVAAVIPVHTFGLPAQVDAIAEVVSSLPPRRRPKVLYDAAHGFGSALDSRRVGTFGEAEVFSLSATKVLVSIEGGMVASSDNALIERVKRMRNYGIESNYDAWYPGLNGKMSELHALVGLTNLRRLNYLMDRRQRAATYFRRQISTQTSFELQPWPANVVHTFKDFSVVVPERLATRTDALKEFLAERGIETRRYFYPPVHRQRYFRQFGRRPLPVTDRLAGRVLCLPFFSSISEAQMDRVVAALVEAATSL